MDFRFYTASVVFLLMFLNVSHSSKYDRDNWVDPDDIMNYDRASKTMIPVEKAKKHRNNWLDPDSPHDTPSENNCYNVDHAKEVLEFKAKLAECQSSLINTVKCDNVPTAPTAPTVDGTRPTPHVRANVMRSSEMVFMKRFVGILLDASSLAGVRLDAGDTRRVNVAVEVDSEQLAVLQRFGEGDATLGQLNDVMSVVLKSTESGFYVPLGWLERFAHFFSQSDLWYRMMPYACTLLVLAMLILRRPALEIVATFLILVFALSYQWTYEYLIKMAEIKQYVEMKQFEQVPASCLPAASVFEFLRRKLTGTEADCHKYHVAQMMPAALVVTPTLVLADMLSTMLVHPMGKLGGGIASFTTGLLDGLSWWQSLFVLPLVFALITFLLAVFGVILFGGRLRLPFLLGGFELSGQQGAPRHIHTTHRVEEIAQLPAPANALPPNPVNVNIYLDGAMFSSPREVIQQLAVVNDCPRRNGVEETLAIDACLMDADVLTTDASKVLAHCDALTKEANALGDLINLSDTTVNAVDDDLAVKMLTRRIYEAPEAVVEPQSLFLETIEQIAGDRDFGAGDPDVGTWRETEPDSIVNTDFITSIERILLESSIEEGGDSDCRESEAKVRGDDGSGFRDTNSSFRGALESERLSDTDAVNDVGATAKDGLRYAAGDCAGVDVPKVARKVSEDSSDGSGDFVKL